MRLRQIFPSRWLVDCAILDRWHALLAFSNAMARPGVLSTSNIIQGKYMNFRRRLSCALTVLVTSLMASTGQATTVKPMNIVDLIDHSATIVAGRVEKVTDGFTAAGLP